MDDICNYQLFLYNNYKRISRQAQTMLFVQPYMRMHKQIKYFMDRQLFEGAQRIRQTYGETNYQQIQSKKIQRIYKFYLPRLRNIQRDRQSDLPVVQFEIDVLNCDQKEQFPNQILYHSFNLYPQNKYRQGNLLKFIPGNFLYRQFSYYFQYYFQNFNRVNQLQITYSQYDSSKLNIFNKLKKFVSKQYNSIERKEQKILLQKIKKHLKTLKKLAKIFSSKNSYTRQQCELCQQYSKVSTKLKKYCILMRDQIVKHAQMEASKSSKYTTLLQKFDKIFEDINPYLESFFIDADKFFKQRFEQRFQKEKKYRQNYKKKSIQILFKKFQSQSTKGQINQYKEFHQKLQNQKRKQLCKQNRNDMEQWFKNKINLNFLHYVAYDEEQKKYEKFIVPNLTLGRFSYVYQKEGRDKMVGFSPFVYPAGSANDDKNYQGQKNTRLNTKLQKYRKNWVQQLAQNNQANSDHPQRQILRLVKRTLKKMLNKQFKSQIQQYKNLRKAKYIVIDMMSQRSLCQPIGSSGQNQICKCSHQIPLYIVKQLQQVTRQLNLDIGIYLRYGFNEPYRVYGLSKISQSNQQGSCRCHLVQLVKDKDPLLDQIMKFLFKPKHMFISSHHKYLHRTNQQLNKNIPKLESDLENLINLMENAMNLNNPN